MMKNQKDETITRIRRHLNTLNLTTIQNILDEELARAVSESISSTELIERLLSREVGALIERRIERRIRESKLPQRKLLSDFDFDFQKGIDKGQILELSKLNFVDQRQGIVLAGNSGTGKSHIAKALLLIGCQKLYRCRYTTSADMLKDLIAGMPDDTVENKLKRYITPDILLIDEIGFDRIEQHDARNASLFFKVIEGRYCKNSTVITTNIDFKALGDYLGDPVATTAIVDRMVHHSIIINIQGPSYRIFESTKLNAKPK
ncbi:MAG: ATP-binding protein [Nitrospirae bacterium]|nr:ATP-binding protein [Nitrospirota bacterium]